MGANSKIEWTDHTWNPWIGCSKVSPGCDHCYAERDMSTRLKVVQWGSGAPRKRTSEANWRESLRWNAQAQREGRRYRVFCASLADVFDNEVPAQWRGELWSIIRATPHLDWLLLTKRIGNAAGMLPADWFDGWPNVWLGASIVNQAEADRDIPKLLAVPAAKRFLSMEPLLGPVDLTCLSRRAINDDWTFYDDALTGFRAHKNGGSHGPKLDWVIVGGESGPKARPMHPAWVRSLRDQCNAAGVPFFFKQWGEWGPYSRRSFYPAGVARDGSFVGPDEQFTDECALMYRNGKQAAGRLLDGRTWDEVPA